MFDDRYAEAKFSKSGVLDKVPAESTFIIVDTRIYVNHSVGLVERSLRAKKQTNPFIPFDRRPTCDRQTDRHRQTRTQGASIASVALVKFAPKAIN